MRRSYWALAMGALGAGGHRSGPIGGADPLDHLTFAGLPPQQICTRGALMLAGAE